MTNPLMATSAILMGRDLKRSVSIRGHRTSLSLESEFWDALQKLARMDGKSVSALIAEIDDARRGRNLSSAIRVFVLQRIQARA